MAAQEGLNENTQFPPREDLVDTAVKFLQNPKVSNTALAQKQKFLQRKGLTDEEIKLACERSGAYALHDQQIRATPILPPPVGSVASYNPYAQVQLGLFERVRDVLHSATIFGLVAYAIYKFYQKFIAPFLFGKKKKSVEDSLTDLDKNLKTSVDELRNSLTSVKVEVDRINQGTDQITVRQLHELKTEISSVKGLLLSRKQFPAVSSNSPVVPPSIPAWQMSSVQSEPDHDPDNPDHDRKSEDLMEIGSGSGSSEPEHCTHKSDSSLEIIYSKESDSESYHHRRKSSDDLEKV